MFRFRNRLISEFGIGSRSCIRKSETVTELKKNYAHKWEYGAEFHFRPANRPKTERSSGSIPMQDQDVSRSCTKYKFDMMFELQAQVYSHFENFKLKYSVDTSITITNVNIFKRNFRARRWTIMCFGFLSLIKSLIKENQAVTFTISWLACNTSCLKIFKVTTKLISSAYTAKLKKTSRSAWLVNGNQEQ